MSAGQKGDQQLIGSIFQSDDDLGDQLLSATSKIIDTLGEGIGDRHESIF